MLEPALLFLLSDRTSCLPRCKSNLLCRGLGTCAVTTHPNPHQTPFSGEKNQDKHFSSSGSNESTQTLPLVCPWVLMPYRFMGLAVLMLQCLLASLREVKNNQRNRGNAPMTTLAKNDTHIQDSLQAVGYLHLQMSITIQPSVKV